MKNLPLPFLFLFLLGLTTFLACEETKPPRFKLVAASKSGIHFNNTIQENEEVNVLNL